MACRCLAIPCLVEAKSRSCIGDCVNAVVRLSPDFHPIYYEIGIALGSQGRMPEAIAALEKGLSIGAGASTAFLRVISAFPICLAETALTKALVLMDTLRRRENL